LDDYIMWSFKANSKQIRHNPTVQRDLATLAAAHVQITVPSSPTQLRGEFLFLPPFEDFITIPLLSRNVCPNRTEIGFGIRSVCNLRGFLIASISDAERT
jgi:hypothetical protein